MMVANKKLLNVFILGVLLALYFGAIGVVSLTDPDEVFYSMTAQEMLHAKSFLTPLIFDQPQFEKPPLFYWGLLASFKAFGVHSVSARLVPALCGLLGIAATFWFCRRVFNERTAYLCAVMLAASALYLAMSKAVLTDIMLSVLITCAFYAFYSWFREAKDSSLYAYAVFAALAVLTKGPIAIIILGLACVIFLSVTKEFSRLRSFLFHPWVLVFLMVSVPWYAWVTAKYGRAFIDEFIIRDNWDRILYAEHKNFDKWYFYPTILTVGLFPWVFYLAAIGRGWKKRSKECLFLLIWVAVTFIVFQRAHSKLASYIVPAIPAWVILLGISVDDLKNKDKRLKVLSILYGVLGLALCVVPFVLARKFAAYIWPEALIAVVLLALAFIVSAVFLFRGDVFKAVLTKAAGLALLILIVGFGAPASIDREVANQYLQKIVSDENYAGEPIVAGKLYSRGIHFHTGNPVVVWDHNPQPFWSPHPIRVISSQEDITDFFESRPKVICVIKSAYLDELNRTFKDRRENRVVARDGKKVVVVSTRI